MERTPKLIDGILMYAQRAMEKEVLTTQILP